MYFEDKFNKISFLDVRYENKVRADIRIFAWATGRMEFHVLGWWSLGKKLVWGIKFKISGVTD